MASKTSATLVERKQAGKGDGLRVVRAEQNYAVLLGNLHDFKPEHAVKADALTLIDRWILERLHVVTAEEHPVGRGLREGRGRVVERSTGLDELRAPPDRSDSAHRP